jgi:hypothetical protein
MMIRAVHLPFEKVVHIQNPDIQWLFGRQQNPEWDMIRPGNKVLIWKKIDLSTSAGCPNMIWSHCFPPVFAFITDYQGMSRERESSDYKEEIERLVDTCPLKLKRILDASDQKLEESIDEMTRLRRRQANAA